MRWRERARRIIWDEVLVVGGTWHIEGKCLATRKFLNWPSVWFDPVLVELSKIQTRRKIAYFLHPLRTYALRQPSIQLRQRQDELLFSPISSHVSNTTITSQGLGWLGCVSCDDRIESIQRF